ncbi:MAG: acyl-CoA dehydrogenase [Nitrospinaceae bacterium]|nr:acyl-CoA dehydrogenase [Nitrospinaceae bacterium]NIR57764.1 acyl-CoA dehydrogenase [Nitrospinaceae bacterium]NIS88226.1 acyl-CoA dehydrogenase [Nitrospinaceae bacterium]NIT85106.1 acyl-CoA dehydrogenase [Nitrospinaceae bacterium]NIU47263.1 acyl-CoA dehydrogenase [Nitrospinaceae bacterium]
MLPLDFYKMEMNLTDEEKLVQETAGQFVDREVIPIISDCFEQGEFPKPLIKKMGEEGFFGAMLPTHGGAGLGPVAYGLMMLELERGDSGLRSFASVQNGLVIYPINRFGSQEQKDKWLPGLVTGDKVGCFGLTEPDFGSNPAGMKTTAVKDGNDYVLNGSKSWITNSDISDYVIIWAYVGGVARAFVVEAGTPGMRLQPIHHKFSMRASDTGEIHLNDCRVPADCMLPGAEGMVAAYSCLNQARYSIAWGVLGAAIACYNEALEYSKTRIMFDKPIGSFQLVQEKLADMVTGITCGQLLCLQLGRLMEQDKHDYTQISMAKRNNVRVALDVARKARDILGASGISVEYQTIRHMLNLESVITYEGTDSIHTLILGKKVTGLDAVG